MHIYDKNRQKSIMPDFIKNMRLYKGPDKHFEAFVACFQGLEDDREIASLRFFQTLLVNPPTEDNPEYGGTAAYLRVYQDKPMEFIDSILTEWVEVTEEIKATGSSKGRTI